MPTPGMTVRKRLLWLTAAIPLLFCMVLLRVGHLSIVESESLTSRGIVQWTRNGAVAAARGKILDRSGKTLVQSATAYIVCATPSQVRNAQGMADILCPMLDIDREVLIQKVSQKAQSSVILKRQVSRETVDALRELAQLEENKRSGALSGLTFDEDRVRFYSMGSFMAQALGLTNIDGVGQSGLEQQYNAYLAGTPGRIVTEVDAKARVLAGGNEYYVPPTEGASIKLTVDQSIQSFIDKALRECIEVNGAQRVMAIMMDVKTGGILGMGIKPDYDPNSPPRDDLDLLQTLMRIQTISDVYEPGSTFKIFTTATALDLKLTNPSDGFYCSGSITVDGDRIRCWGNPHGAESLQKALQNSCNPVFVELGLRIGTENFYRYLRAFGFGVPTGIDLPGESGGLLIGQKYVKTVDLARIGFGQSVAVTPLQMITAACAVVNGGKLMKPYLVSEVIAADGTVLERATPQIVSQPISEATSATMRMLLESVVSDGGGRNAGIAGYRIGGKTGTAQVYRDGRVVHDVHIGSFLGFAPADDPEVAILVIVDEAKLMPDYGGTTAAPFARQILLETLQYLGVRAQVDATPQTQVEMPDVTGLPVREATNQLKELGLSAVTDGGEATVIAQMPVAGATLWTGSQVMLYVREGGAPDAQTLVQVPNVSGLSILEANRQLRARKLVLEISGNGLASSQVPAAGEFAQPGDTVKVTFTAP